MLSFDETLSELVSKTEQSTEFEKIRRAMVVRDLHGRLRLAVVADPDQKFAKLTKELKQALGAWFPDPVVTKSTNNSHLFNTITDANQTKAKSLDGFQYELAPGRGLRPVAQGRWWLTERRISKQTWFDQPATPAWALGAGPAIVSFFSFKGGVGRTTIATAVAINLGLLGKRVVVIDLDLEAPGIASVLIDEETPGLIDLLADHLATCECDPAGLLRAATGIGSIPGQVEVLPAGVLNSDYFEKLARLDFVGTDILGGGESPIEKALLSVLRKIAFADPRPDFILVDARAGLHDLAGLSLQGLAHIEVLIARDSEQSYRGLDLVVERLGMREPDQLRCAVVQSMAPYDKGSQEYASATTQFRSRVWQAFSESVYADDDIPAEEDVNAAHYPLVIPFSERLLRFSSIEAVRGELEAPHYKEVVAKIIALAAEEV